MERMTKTFDPVGEIREVLIAATDMVPVGEEPYVGWSAVLADRIAAALGLDDLDAAVKRANRAYIAECNREDRLQVNFGETAIRAALEAALTATSPTSQDDA